MSGLFVQKLKDKLGTMFKVRYSYIPIEDWEPRYNLLPGQKAIAVRIKDPEKGRKL